MKWVRNKLKEKKVIFKGTDERSVALTSYPISSINFFPDWFKKTKLFSNGKNDYLEAAKFSDFHFTFKLCTPLTDSMSLGYMITLPAGVHVKNFSQDTYNPIFEWKTTWDVLDSQSNEVLGMYPIPTGYFKGVFRWRNLHRTITPKGYSLLVTHPIHRHDLPFLTLTAIIDTDMHPNSVTLPFFIKEGFEGTIEEGTPIAQIIPFKRDNWYSETQPFTLDEQFYVDRIKSGFIRTYKKKYWSKKRYR